MTQDNPFLIRRNANQDSPANSKAPEQIGAEPVDRQADGCYTLTQAATAIAENGKANLDSILWKLTLAVTTKQLPVYEPGLFDRFHPAKVNSTYETAVWDDLNAWLDSNEERILWRFPKPISCEIQGTSEVGSESNARAHSNIVELVKSVDPEVPEIQSTPGKIPRIKVAQCAVVIAWNIECKEGRRATAQQVMAVLQKWAADGIKPTILSEPTRDSRGVMWTPYSGKPKKYSLEMCGAAIQKWRNSF